MWVCGCVSGYATSPQAHIATQPPHPHILTYSHTHILTHSHTHTPFFPPKHHIVDQPDAIDVAGNQRDHAAGELRFDTG